MDGVSFDVAPGETLALVGESGCGKSTTGRAILRLIEPTSGSVHFDGQDVLALDASDLRKLRRQMQIVFQDPFSSLNPRMSIGAIVREGLTIHNLAEGAPPTRACEQLLEEVGLRPEYAIALSARVLRRPAAARRHRARALRRADASSSATSR